MFRTVLGLLVFLLVILVLVTGVYYPFPDSGPAENGERSVRALLPEDLTGVARLNVNQGTLRRLERIPLFNSLRNSRFPEAFRSRILPILTLATDRLKANRPFLSRYLLRYLDDSELYVFRERSGGSVGVVELSRFGEKRPSAEVRDHLRTWVLDPARRHGSWSVRKESVVGIPSWTLRRSLPEFTGKISFSVSLADPYLVISRRRRDLARTLRRYRRSTRSKQEPVPMPQVKDPVEFAFGQDPLERILAGGSFPVKSDSGSVDTVGRISVRGNRIVLDVDSSGKGGISRKNDRADSNLLRYHPSTSSLVLQAQGLYDNGYRPERWFRSLAGPPYTNFLEQLDRKLVRSPTFSVRRPLSERGESLLVLKTSDRETFRTALREDPDLLYEEDERQLTSKAMGWDLYLRWHRGRFLLSRERSGPEKAIDRYRGRNGFLNRLRAEDLEKHTRHPYRLMAYGSATRALDGNNFMKEIPDRWVRRTRLLLGFNPVSEARQVAEGVPGTLLVVRFDRRRKLSTKLVTAGDPLLPVYFGWAFLERRTKIPAIFRSLRENVEERLKDSLD